MQQPTPLTEEDKVLVNKYCRVSSRMEYQDAEEILREKGADYVKKRIAKMEKRKARLAIAPKPDLSILIKGIATAYYLNNDSEKLDLIMEDLQYLGFADITCAPEKIGEYTSSHKMIFSGRHTDPEVQAEFIKTPRTDVLFQYMFEYGQLNCLPFGGSLGQKEAGTHRNSKLESLAYHISGRAGGRENKESYIMRVHGVKQQDTRDTYHWNVIWQAGNVEEELVRKEADKFAEEKQAAISSARKDLEEAVSNYQYFVVKCLAYALKYNEPMSTFTETAGGPYPGMPEVTFVVSGDGTTCPTVTITKVQEETDEETQELVTLEESALQDTVSAEE